MKSIPLRTVEIKDSDNLVYADALRTIIRQPKDPQKGVSIEEMRKGIRLLDKLDESTDELVLEDADYNHLKEKLEGMSWGVVDRSLMEFIDTILNAPEVTANGVAH